MKLDEKLLVAVLMGGPSAEHEISLKSGQGVIAALKRIGFDVEPVIVPKDISTKQAEDFVRSALLASNADVSFIALHGPFGEDGTVQAICEGLKIAYTGSGPLASRLGLDKVASKIQFEQAGLFVPKWQLIQDRNPQSLDMAIRSLGFPVVVKPANQGSSIGVSIAAHHADFLEAISEASRYDTKIIIEEFIKGRELTVGILDQNALPVVEIKSSHQFFDFTAKYTAGQTSYIVPADIDKESAWVVQDAALRAHKALGCRHFSRADIILDASNRPFVLEVNTIPGLTQTSLLPKSASCVGMSYDELCENFILMAFHDRPKSQKSRMVEVRAKAYA
jgi:D-alanine-D-alanine ligase